MSDDLIPFGHPVRLDATVRPVYLAWNTRRQVQRPLTLPGNVFFDIAYEDLPEPVLVNNSENEHDSDIGLPLDGSAEVPKVGVHRRLRRFPTEVQGVVVGRVLRQEGQYHAQSGGGFSEYGDYDWEPAYLSQERAVWLYQVAVSTFDGTRLSSPARIVLAHPDDIGDIPEEEAA